MQILELNVTSYNFVTSVQSSSTLQHIKISGSLHRNKKAMINDNLSIVSFAT